MGYEASFPEDWGADDWMNLLFTNAVSKQRGYTLERLKKEKVIQFTTTEVGEPHIRGKSAPLPTESKRVQLYCENPKPRLNWGQEHLPGASLKEHIVYYQPPEEAGADNPLAEKYPHTSNTRVSACTSSGGRLPCCGNSIPSRLPR